MVFFTSHYEINVIIHSKGWIKLELEEVLVELNNLNERINLVDSNLKFNITIFLGLLTLFLGLAGWALYLFAKNIVDKSVQIQLIKIKQELKQETNSEIKQISGELNELKSNLDQRILQLIENNSRIRWAGGSINGQINGQYYIGGLQGNINWDSPVTSVRIRDRVNRRDVPFELIEKGESNFSFKILSEVPSSNLEWIIVWYEKSK